MTHHHILLTSTCTTTGATDARTSADITDVTSDQNPADLTGPTALDATQVHAVTSPTMTTIVGVREPDFVIIGSDSRTTLQPSGVTSDHRRKLHLVGPWLVAVAGDDDAGDRWLDAFRDVQHSGAINPEVAAVTIATIRRDLGRLRNTSPNQIVANAFVGWHDGETFRLTVCDATPTGIAIRDVTQAVNSSAGERALRLEALLPRHPTAVQTLVSVAAVISYAKAVDAGTGGPVQLGIVDAGGARLCDASDIERSLAGAWKAVVEQAAAVAR